MYVLSLSAEGECYLCVPPDPGIEAAALGASESVLPGTVPAEALQTFTLASGASRCFFRDSATLTPLLAPISVRLADPSGGPVVSCSSTVPPCPALPSNSLSGLHLPSLSTNLVAPACSCRLPSHQTLLWHHRQGHPSLPSLRGMHSDLLISGLPRSLPPLMPSLAPPCLPCVEGRQQAAPHSSSFPLTTAPLQTLHMDVWGSARVIGYGREHYFCCGEGILKSFTLPDSPQQNGIAEHRIGLVIEVARTSMIHAAAPHFLWPFAVRYAAHLLNLWPRVSLPETSPTLRWTGEVGDASVFWVWGSRAFIRDTSVDKLSACAIPCIFRVFPSQDVMFDEPVPFYRLFSYRSAFPPPSPLFLAPGPPPVDPLPPQGPATSAGDSSAARGTAFGGAEPGGAKSEGAGSGSAEPTGVEPGGAEPEGVEPGGAEFEGAESWGAEPRCIASSGGRAATRDTEDTGARGAGVTAGAGGRGGVAGDGHGGARTRGTGAAETGGCGSVGAGDPTEPGAAGAGGAGAGGTGAGGAGPGGAGAGGAGAGGTGAGGTGAGGAGARGADGIGSGGTMRRRLYFVPLLQQVHGIPSSSGLNPPLQCPLPDQTQPPIQPASPLPTPSPYSEQSGYLTERCEPVSRPASPVRTGRRLPRPSPPPVPGTHAMALRPSSVPLHVPLRAPSESSLPAVPDPKSDRARAASPTVSRLLATVVTDPSFESTTTSALIAELVDFAAACPLDYATTLVAESESVSPPSVGSECALGTDVLEDRQEDFECLGAAVPRFASMLLAPEGDPDAPDIPTPRTYAEAITGPSSSQWQAAMDAKMASWNSTGTYVDAVPPSWANILVYGLHQAPREWHDTLRSTFAALKFTPSTADLVYRLSLLTRYVAPGRHRKVHWDAPKRVLRYLCSTSGMGLVLGGRGPVVLTGHADAYWVDDSATLRSSQGYTFSHGSGFVSWRSTRSSSFLSSSCEAEIYAGAMAAQELRWLTYLLTDMGEQPGSPPVLYADNKAMIALC
ncbi:unnamed protein product [Closterium sp. NIES-54]